MRLLTSRETKGSRAGLLIQLIKVFTQSGRGTLCSIGRPASTALLVPLPGFKKEERNGEKEESWKREEWWLDCP